MKLELNYWIKTDTAHGHSVRNCWHCVQKVYGNDMLPYQNATEWIEAFCQGQDVTKDNQCAGQPNIPQELVQLVKSLLEDDMHCPMCKLAVKLGLLILVFVISLWTSSRCKKWHHIGYHTNLQAPICDKDMLLLTSTFNGTTMKIVHFCNVSDPQDKTWVQVYKPELKWQINGTIQAPNIWRNYKRHTEKSK